MITFTLTVTAQDEAQVIRLAQFHGYKGSDFEEAKEYARAKGQETMSDFVAEPFKYDLKLQKIAEEKAGGLAIDALADQSVVAEIIEE